MNKLLIFLTFFTIFFTLISSFPTTLNKRASFKPTQTISSKSAFTYYWDEFESDHKEGTGITKTNRVLNFGDCDCSSKSFSCFDELDKTKFPFGSTSNDTPLVPYITVAANDIRKGTLLYIPKLDGMLLPNGKTHNGCVKADDTGDSFGGKHIDWFVARESNFEFLTNRDPFESVSVFNGTLPNGQNCALLNYS
ncbi:carbohydrate-binding module family 50 protein [Rhizophagus clarus]|uniref:Carbohydrate-binding module family 50 protein n=1 Tax=Rhizophagus clarus TaxID=94130 RepID=A0A8H3LYV9_9GLOM|nr:carbohydrate-binding module family 50 protein [Rhizophagus clarus]